MTTSRKSVSQLKEAWKTRKRMKFIKVPKMCWLPDHLGKLFEYFDFVAMFSLNTTNTIPISI